MNCGIVNKTIIVGIYVWGRYMVVFVYYKSD